MFRSLLTLTALSLTLAAAPPKTQTAVFAGGCFWGVDAVFRHVKGVVEVVSGYAGGDTANPTYEVVSTGTTGFAESVRITFDPSQVTYDQLLDVFFAVAHDPTELNRQGPDVGTQYRSAIFYTSPEQHRAAILKIQALTERHAYPAPIVTHVARYTRFYEAEAYHQNYLARNLDSPYIVYNDLPKLARLKERFPALYRP
ncbi:MAG TPA: peptide-methionine (S)-S-oxide reductase MsrA [Gemmatimonadales bacterium]